MLLYAETSKSLIISHALETKQGELTTKGMKYRDSLI